MSKKTALVTGATGLVGKELIKLMLEEDYYEKIVVFSRRSMQFSDDRVEEVIINDFDKLDDYADKFNENHIYCCIGTTLKDAGSKEMFKKIDLEYPLKMAEISKKQPNFECYLIVTAVGSNPDSALFYNEVKGHLEKALIDLELPSLKIFRPSLLLGKRERLRIGEEFAKAACAFLSFFVVGSRGGRLWSIKASDVAKSMLIVSKDVKKGVSTFSPKEMVQMAFNA